MKNDKEIQKDFDEIARLICELLNNGVDMDCMESSLKALLDEYKERRAAL